MEDCQNLPLVEFYFLPTFQRYSILWNLSWLMLFWEIMWKNAPYRTFDVTNTIGQHFGLLTVSDCVCDCYVANQWVPLICGSIHIEPWQTLREIADAITDCGWILSGSSQQSKSKIVMVYIGCDEMYRILVGFPVRHTYVFTKYSYPCLIRLEKNFATKMLSINCTFISGKNQTNLCCK